MSDSVRQTLCRAVQQHGRSLIDDPRRCESLLRDLCPSNKREVNLLVAALRERVPADLAASQGASTAIRIQGLVSRLQQVAGLAEDAARWAVDSWALALGVIAPDALAAAAHSERIQPRPAARNYPADAVPSHAPDGLPRGTMPDRESQAGRSKLLVLLLLLLVLGGAGAFFLSSDLRNQLGRLGIAAPGSNPSSTQNAQPPEVAKVPPKTPVVGETRPDKEGQERPKPDPERYHIIYVVRPRGIPKNDAERLTADTWALAIRAPADLDKGMRAADFFPDVDKALPAMWERLSGPWTREDAARELARRIDPGSLRAQPGGAWTARLDGRTVIIDQRGPVHPKEIAEYAVKKP
jgi:hypothetical protein